MAKHRRLSKKKSAVAARRRRRAIKAGRYTVRRRRVSRRYGRKHRGGLVSSFRSSGAIRRRLKGAALRAHKKKYRRLFGKARYRAVFGGKRRKHRFSAMRGSHVAGRRDSAAREAWALKQAALGAGSAIPFAYR